MGRFDPLWSRPFYRDPVVIVAAYLGVGTAFAIGLAPGDVDLGFAAVVGIAVFLVVALVGAAIRKVARRWAAAREVRRRRREDADDPARR